MNSVRKLFIIAGIFLMAHSLTGCIFEEVNQPSSAQPGEVINISLKITDNIVPETNPHKGILGIIVPADWEFVSATYTSTLGNGVISLSPEWKDSLNKYYPTSQFGNNMKWIGLISDIGYTYNNTTSFFVDLKLKVGQTQGCFNLGYLTSKATSGLLGQDPNWAPLSFPHSIGVPDSNLCASIYEVRQAFEWDNLLDTHHGWTGSDGIYTIPLDEFDAPSNTPADSQLILFSDTFIGDVDSLGRRLNTKMVNNTLALLPSNVPDTSKIKFFWRVENGQPKTVFVPNTPNAKPGDWYWLMDGIAIGDNVYVYALRLNGTQGGFGFELNGVVLLKFNMDSVSFIKNVQQIETPFFLEDTVANWDFVLGQAIMPMTEASGNPSPDGYIYVYGPKSSSGGKELMAARVLPENIENFNLYQFWNGTTWSNNINELVPLTNGISQEFSVTPLTNGKFLLVYQMGSSVAVRIGDSPVGPFGIFHKIYDAPEVMISPNVFIYNAKAHPSLSNTDELLISYNVNTMSFAEHFSNADIYRPRFIYLTINDTTSTSVNEEESSIPEDFKLQQNYPNPFNPSTMISFSVPQAGRVAIKIFNLLGEIVTELTNKYYQAGNYNLKFDASANLSSGVYLYRMESGDFVQTNKMVLIR